MMRIACALALGLALIAPVAAQQPPRPAPAPTQRPAPVPTKIVAVVQTLDKITGRVRTVEADIGQTFRFGTLDVVIRACRKRPPEEPPESAGLVEIREARPGEAPRLVFDGWMFASSPALSALEHPIYDLWIIDCKTVAEASPSPR